MNILITGYDGFIGKHICNFLETNKHLVFKISKDVAPQNEYSFDIDLTNNQKVLEFAEYVNQENIKIDIIIHLAFVLANVKQDENKQLYSFNQNIKISENIVSLTKQLKPKKIINFSSMAVYPNIDGVFDEKSEIKTSENSDCLYGLAKFCAENIFDYFLKNEGIIISHLRIAQVYGKGMRNDRIVPVMEKELKEKNRITVFGNGKRISSFLNIDKLIEYINYFILYNFEGVYNVGHESLSFENLAKNIIKKQGNSNSQIIKVKKGIKSKFRLNSEKLTKQILKYKNQKNERTGKEI